MVKMLIQVPRSIKDKLDAMRSNGYTASGYIRSLLERELNKAPTGQTDGECRIGERPVA